MDYAVTVANAGPQTATGIRIAATLPIGVSVFSAPAGCARIANQLACELPDLAPGDHVGLDFALAAAVAGTWDVSVQASAAIPDENDADNRATLSTAVNSVARRDGATANLKAEITGPVSAKAGRRVLYKLRVRNLGPAAARSVALAVTLPAGAAVLPERTDARCRPSAEGLLCRFGDLARKQKAKVTLALSFGTVGKQAQSISATALNGDPKPANNSARLKTRVKRSARN